MPFNLGFDAVMRILIQDTESRLYLCPRSCWSDDARDATDFCFTAHAHSVAQGLRLKQFHILMYFPESDHRIVVGGSADTGVARV